MDCKTEKATARKPSWIYLPSGMISAFRSASCTLSLVVAGRSLKACWRGLSQAPDNFVKTAQIKTMDENVTQCIVRRRSVVFDEGEVC